MINLFKFGISQLSLNKLAATVGHLVTRQRVIIISQYMKIRSNDRTKQVMIPYSQKESLYLMNNWINMCQTDLLCVLWTASKEPTSQFYLYISTRHDVGLFIPSIDGGVAQRKEYPEQIN